VVSVHLRILLVDDEVFVLNSLRRLLGREEFAVQTAASGREGLALLEKETFDLVLSDYKMPSMNGIEFLTEVARRWPATVRAMLTAQADEDLLAKSLASGVLARAFTKPWDNRELVEGLQQVAAGKPA
ncbi:MAG: response regulator, partial [Planctomycetota bacterium]